MTFILSSSRGASTKEVVKRAERGSGGACEAECKDESPASSLNLRRARRFSKHRPRVDEEPLPRRQEPRPPRRAREERRAQIVFEAPDPSRQRRLGDVQSPRRACLDAGIAIVRGGARLGDIGAAVEETARRAGCTVVCEFGGHGIGRAMHAPRSSSTPCW